MGLLMLCSSVFSSFLLFVYVSFLLAFYLWLFSPILSLLLLLIYLGGLLVLVAYFWMLLPLTPLFFSFSFVFFLFPLLLNIQPPSSSGSFSFFVIATSLLLVFGCYLFLAILVVVHLVNLSEGSFSS